MNKETGAVDPALFCTASNTHLGLGGLIQEGLAVGQDGCFYVSDGARPAKVWPTGETELLARDFATVQGIAVDAAGNVFVSDREKGCVIKLNEKQLSWNDESNELKRNPSPEPGSNWIDISLPYSILAE